MRSGVAFLSLIGMLAVPLIGAHAQCYNCYEDAGNLCYASCGVVALDQYDDASPYPNGNFCCATAMYPQCTDTCTGHGIGIDYSDYRGYPCYLSCYTVNQASVALIKKIAPGSSIYTTTCSDSVIAIDQLPARTTQPRLPRIHLALNLVEGDSR